MLVLSLFPGIGLFDMAFELEGVVVVRGPDPIWGGDIRNFHPPAGKFDGIIGGPPCQMFSSLAHLVRANGCEPRFGNLIPEFERCVTEAEPDWFVMENVPKAPEPVIDGYGIRSFLLNNCWLPGDDDKLMGQEQERLRRFSFGRRGKEPVSLMRWIDLAVFQLQDKSGTITIWAPNNSKEAKTKHECITGGHDRPPSQRCESKVVTAGGDKIENVIAWSKRRRRKQRTVTSNVGGFTDGSQNPKRRVKPVTQVLSETPVKIKTAAATSSDGGASVRMRRYRFEDACRLQGLPEDFLKDSPFRADGKLKAVANGVPIPMGRAIARAVMECMATKTK